MSSFLSRRAANRRAVVTHKMIAFRIQQEWFALPIQAAQRVIPMGQVYGISCQSEISLTRYQDKDIIVIDAERRIFGRTLEMKGQGAAVRGQEEDAGVERMGSTQDLAQDSTLNPQNSASAFSQILSEPSYLLIVQNPQGELIGIPLDSAPSLRRVPRSAFAPLPPTYLTEGGVRCVSALIVLNPKEAPLFLLNLDQLLQSRSTLPITEPHQSLTGN